MCTVSWMHEGDGYQLLSNRDEKRARLPASQPQVMTRDGVRFLAPIDGNFGGTWIAVNEFGLSLVLLNRGSSAPAWPSRGLLLLNWISAQTQAEVTQNIRAASLSGFAGFALAVLEPGISTAVFTWDGEKLTQTPDAESHMPLVSSSFDPAAVDRERRAEFLRLRECARGLQIGALLALHASHRPARGPYSPCMHREDAETVSFTWITVTPAEVKLYYEPGPPCQSLAGESRGLERAHGTISA